MKRVLPYFFGIIVISFQSFAAESVLPDQFRNTEWQGRSNKSEYRLRIFRDLSWDYSERDLELDPLAVTKSVVMELRSIEGFHVNRGDGFRVVKPKEPASQTYQLMLKSSHELMRYDFEVLGGLKNYRLRDNDSGVEFYFSKQAEAEPLDSVAKQDTVHLTVRERELGPIHPVGRGLYVAVAQGTEFIEETSAPALLFYRDTKLREGGLPLYFSVEFGEVSFVFEKGRHLKGVVIARIMGKEYFIGEVARARHHSLSLDYVQYQSYLVKMSSEYHFKMQNEVEQFRNPNFIADIFKKRKIQKYIESSYKLAELRIPQLSGPMLSRVGDGFIHSQEDEAIIAKKCSEGVRGLR
jgi:hypothetical protein